jgi:hypothetical protein
MKDSGMHSHTFIDSVVGLQVVDFQAEDCITAMVILPFRVSPSGQHGAKRWLDLR